MSLIQSKQVMVGVTLCDDLLSHDLPTYSKHQMYPHLLGNTPSPSLTFVQEEALSFWNYREVKDFWARQQRHVRDMTLERGSFSCSHMEVEGNSTTASKSYLTWQKEQS